MKTTIYEPRWYRNQCAESKLEQFFVRYQESDLCIRSETNLSSLAYNILIRVRKELEAYIIRHSEFGRSLVPVSVLGDAPDIAQEMAQAALKTGVGPMA